MKACFRYMPAIVFILALSLSACGGGNSTVQGTTAAVSEGSETTDLPKVVPVGEGEEEQYKDGEYQAAVTLQGGSGKAGVSSPTTLILKDGSWTLKLLWSSSNYDYMIVDGVKYLPVSTEDGSLFEIPLSEPSGELEVIADTTAMSIPHEIEYTLLFSPVGEEGAKAGTGKDSGSADDISSNRAVPEAVAEWQHRHEAASSMELKYATCFSVDCYEDGSSLVNIKESGDFFLLVPEDAPQPDDLPEEIRVLHTPLRNIYLSTSGAMDMFRAMDALWAVRFTSTNVSGWDMPEVTDAMEKGDILYIGKYSAPDYERLLADGCDLAVENTMIYHAPEVKEQLENLDIPVLVDYTSYENEPLGRCEWIKLYGLLCGCEEEADAAFKEQERLFLDAASGEPSGKTVAFFYINQSGLINVRRSYDYLAQMIGLAGGDYIFHDLGSFESNSPNISMQMEEFYAGAKDADILIYNGSMEGEIYKLDELISMDPLFAKFRAVENGNVFCARKSMYQASMEMGTILSDLRAIFTGNDEEAVYFYRLEQ